MNPSYIQFNPGDKIAQWTIIKLLGSDAGRNKLYLCRCDCGTERAVQARSLKKGVSQSCGCVLKTHGRADKETEYNVWLNIKQRCNNPNHRQYKDYGGRGIKLHPDWYDYQNFRLAVGARPSPDYSLDRINNDGNYEPGNVRWATRREQIRNSRCVRLVTAHGETHNISEWAEITGVQAKTIQMRLSRGYSAEQALSLNSLPNPRRKGRFHEETRTGLFVD